MTLLGLKEVRHISAHEISKFTERVSDVAEADPPTGCRNFEYE